jgi:hypothetical protein
MRKLTLNIGKLQDGTHWLCLADADTTDVYPLATFVSEDHAELFQRFMQTQGYDAVKLPSNDEIENLLGEL